VTIDLPNLDTVSFARLNDDCTPAGECNLWSKSVSGSEVQLRTRVAECLGLFNLFVIRGTSD